MAHIQLSNGKLCLVDDDLLPFLSIYSWCGNGRCAMTTIQGVKVLMHRLITNCPIGMEVDHKNRNPLDNRRDNLRICTHIENSWNSKQENRQYRGVGFDPRDGMYHAQIQTAERHYSFCYNKDPIECAKAYDAAARFHFGQFACTNFPGNDCISATDQVRLHRKPRGTTSVFRGVHFQKQKGKFVAAVCTTIEGKRVKKYAGQHDNEQDAARAYDQLAIEIFGDRAILNFPTK